MPDRVSVPASALERLVADILAGHDMRRDDAETLARVLVWANLRGIDSHGVSRALRYVELFERGDANPRPTIVVDRPRPSLLLIDADRAPGPVALERAMREAIDVARSTGIAWASVRATTLTGAIGYYTSLAAASGMIGLAIVGGMPNMAYIGARGAAVATSPLSIAVPAERYEMVLLDMATAVMALNRIVQLRNQGKELPPGVAATEDGMPTTDPARAAVPLPIAGAKGSGMALVFELLTSVLVSNPIISAYHGGSPEGKRHRQNAALLALDVSALAPRDEFLRAVDATIDALKALPRLEGVDEIRFPGERGARVEQERRAGGIPLPQRVWDALVGESERLGVPAPSPLAG